jgi:hypothetical protein
VAHGQAGGSRDGRGQWEGDLVQVVVIEFDIFALDENDALLEEAVGLSDVHWSHHLIQVKASQGLR